MRRSIGAMILLGGLTLAGCGSTVQNYPAASPPFTPQAECERNGGWWRASMGSCEYQSPGLPVR
jgi:hypothetical protein